MEYIITSLKGDKMTVVSRHQDLNDAMKAGKTAWENAPKGTTISCIKGNINEEGDVTGQYQLYNCWF